MSLEAAAGKNPRSHVGKIYNVVAKEIAEDLVFKHTEIIAAECLIVSRIGSPVSSPALVQIRLATRDGVPTVDLKKPIEDVVVSHLEDTTNFVNRFLAGTVNVF